MLSVPLVAQAANEFSPRFSLKMGATPVIGDMGKQGTRMAIMLAAEQSYPIWKGEAFATGEYRVFYSKDQEATQFGVGYAEGGMEGIITKYVINPTTGVPAPDGRFDSVDLRKNNLEGVTSKIGYRFQFSDMPFIGKLDLQGGLTLGFLKSSQDTSSNIWVLEYRDFAQNSVMIMPPMFPEPTSRLGRESFLATHQTSKFSPGAFIGARSLLTDEMFFEINLSLLGHAEINYVPFSYTGKPAHTETANRFKAVLEFTAGLRF
jgi:hypothetical protein